MSESMTKEQANLYAKQIIENPVYQYIFNLIKVDTLYKWESSKVDAVDEREKYWQRYVALKELDTYIRGFAMGDPKEETNVTECL